MPRSIRRWTIQQVRQTIPKRSPQAPLRSSEPSPDAHLGKPDRRYRIKTQSAQRKTLRSPRLSKPPAIRASPREARRSATTPIPRAISSKATRPAPPMTHSTISAWTHDFSEPVCTNLIYTMHYRVFRACPHTICTPISGAMVKISKRYLTMILENHYKLFDSASFNPTPSPSRTRHWSCACPIGS